MGTAPNSVYFEDLSIGQEASLSNTVTAGVIAVSCLLGAATMARNGVYADEVRFWEDVVRKGPDNARALNNLGYAYALACRTDEADAAFVIALDLAPGDPKSAANLTLLRAGSLVSPGEAHCGRR